MENHDIEDHDYEKKRFGIYEELYSEDDSPKERLKKFQDFIDKYPPRFPKTDDYPRYIHLNEMPISALEETVMEDDTSYFDDDDNPCVNAAWGRLCKLRTLQQELVVFKGIKCEDDDDEWVLKYAH